MLPKKRVCSDISRQVRLANYLSTVVDGETVTAGASEGTQIDHVPILPEEGVRSGYARRWVRNEIYVGRSHHLPALIEYAARGCIGASQRA